MTMRKGGDNKMGYGNNKDDARAHRSEALRALKQAKRETIDLMRRAHHSLKYVFHSFALFP